MTTARWLAAAVLAALALTIISFNASVIARRLRGNGAKASWLPLIGGLCGAAALAVLPHDGFRSYWWLAFIVDPGSLFGLLWAALAARRAR